MNAATLSRIRQHRAEAARDASIAALESEIAAMDPDAQADMIAAHRSTSTAWDCKPAIQRRMVAIQVYDRAH